MLQRLFFALLILLTCICFYVNAINGNTGLLILNVFTVIMSIVNIRQINKRIHAERKAERDKIWRLLGGK